MTPEELQRVLRTEGDYQRNLNQLANGRGWPALLLLIVATLLFLYFYGSP